MGLEFIKSYGGRRLDNYAPQPVLLDIPNEEDEIVRIDLSYEVDSDNWQAITPRLPIGWRPDNWPERPVRFIDGKDVGRVIAWLRSPDGLPVPIRFSQIGSTVMRIVNRECRREFAYVEKVISMVTDLFPWEEVESFGIALQANGFRLVSAYLADRNDASDFARMQKVTEWRTMDEMKILEETSIAQGIEVPTVVDGKLEDRVGGLDRKRSPIFGVIKKHFKNYLHLAGMQILYDLEPGQRTPVFAMPNNKMPVISWYVRLSGAAGALPNWGVVRVEASMDWFKERGEDWNIVDKLSRTLYEYRCRELSYDRAAVSLHPIVRAEESLGALFQPANMLTGRFYRLTGL